MEKAADICSRVIHMRACMNAYHSAPKCDKCLSVCMQCGVCVAQAHTWPPCYRRAAVGGLTVVVGGGKGGDEGAEWWRRRCMEGKRERGGWKGVRKSEREGERKGRVKSESESERCGASERWARLGRLAVHQPLLPQPPRLVRACMAARGEGGVLRA